MMGRHEEVDGAAEGGGRGITRAIGLTLRAHGDDGAVLEAGAFAERWSSYEWQLGLAHMLMSQTEARSRIDKQM